MNLELTGAVVVVTGATRGIGLAIANAFVREGASVVIAGRKEQGLAEARELLGPGVTTCAGDMSLEADVRRVCDLAVSTHGRIDAAVACVGASSGSAGTPPALDAWDEAMRSNLFPAVLLHREAMPHLAKSRIASMVLVGSIAGLESLSAPWPYSAAKAALAATGKMLGRASTPVRVNTVAPGNILAAGGTWARKLERDEAAVRRYIDHEVPMKRFGTADEVADAVLFLSSPRSSFITGACLVVDGGQTRAW